MATFCGRQGGIQSSATGASADMLATNYPPNARRELGLSYEKIARLNPRSIYADITDYGINGPDASKTLWERACADNGRRIASTCWVQADQLDAAGKEIQDQSRRD
ncbi:MAG: L-carnitine dehydratase/bile acid-inducible protein [Nevskia sp.]|nr:L-carnitine dehydratase/bile acid-inducible protein [Nevskia sp.]